MAKALYRKYRSTSLDSVVGQEQVISALQNSLRSGKVGHAYLFVGPRGTGKTSVARILAHEVNGFAYEIEDSYLDIIEIDAASNTGVDNIRDLREKALVAPAVGKYKVYIIDEVHMLSKSAFNALLKTLEEPPAHVIFIMATTDAHKVPVTIVSRSQKYVFRLASEEVMRAHLQKIAEAEGLKVDEGGLSVIARRSGGSFRDALSLLEQAAILADGEVTARVLEEALGLPAEEKIGEILECFTGGESEKLYQVLRELQEMGVRAELVAEELIGRIVRDPKPEYLGLLDRLTEVSGSSFPEVKLLLALAKGSDEVVRGAFDGGVSGTVTRRENLAMPARPQKTGTAIFSGCTRLNVPETPTSNTPTDVPPKNEQVPKDTPQDTSTATSWNEVVAGVKRESIALGAHLSKLHGDLEGDKLIIYAKTKFIKSIVDKGLRLISAQLPGGTKIQVLPEMKPVADERLAKISAIMGAVEEVNIDA